MRLAPSRTAIASWSASLDVEERFREAATRVDALCERLDRYSIAETIQHDDLHDGQVFVRDGVELVLDWGDACISHPFFTLSVTLEGVISWGLDDVQDSVDLTPFRDAYLEPYVTASGGELTGRSRHGGRDRASARLGVPSVNGHVPGDDDQTRTRLRMFLDGQP